MGESNSINHQALVSIVMAARNMQEYIGPAIESVLSQTYLNWELIVVENDSQDETAHVVKRYNDARIVLIQCQSAGLGRARNIGLEKAGGEFICFLDADDLLPPNSIDVRVRFFMEHPDVHFLDGKVETYDSDLKNRISAWMPTIRGHVYHEMHLLQPRCFAGITWMIRRVPNRNLLFRADLSYLEDRFFYLSICKEGKYDFVEETIYTIRRRPESLMTHLKKLENGYVEFMKFTHANNVLSESEMAEQGRQFHKLFFKTYAKKLKMKRAFLHGAKFLFSSLHS